MDSPLTTPAVPMSQIPLVSQYYLHACRTPDDPTIVWGTELETGRMTDYLRRRNGSSDVLISPAHLLVKAVGVALKRHPEFNRRILRGRIYRFREVNVLLPLQKRRLQDGRESREADVCVLRNVDSRPLTDIAAELWRYNRDAARGEFRYGRQQWLFRRLPRFLARWLFRLGLWLANHLNLPVDAYNEQLRAAPVLVNYLGFSGAAPLRSFKPSRFPSECLTLSVTLGPSEPRPVAVDGRVVVRPVAGLFVRADHRIVDAYDLGRFVSTLLELLGEPQRMESSVDDDANEECHERLSGHLIEVPPH